MKLVVAVVALSLELAVIAVLSGAASIALAGGPGTFIDMGGGVWKDPACGTDAMIFKARIYRDINYGDPSWIFCSNYSDFCWVPHGQSSSDAALCANGYDAGTANDYGSSIKISAIYGGALCSVRLYEHKNYGGVAWTQWDPINDSDLRPWPSDQGSSIRRVCT